jgi:bisanhydrobacterioruberin hydratase
MVKFDFIEKNRLLILLIISLVVLLSAIFLFLLDFKNHYSIISMFFMILICLPTYYYFIKYHKKNAFFVIIIISIFSMLIESIGILTGFPYGFFNYTNKLGPKLFVIPFSLSFGFVPLVIGSWFIVETFKIKNLLNKILLGALILIIYDLVIDPGAVALNFWEWEINGIYYGIPISNYFGWLFTGFLSMFIFYFFIKEKPKTNLILFTVFLGNVFWTTIVILNKMIIPSIIGLILLIYMVKLIVKI